MDLGLAQKTVVVTGGSSNIGRAIVLAFAKEGANIVIADIDEAQGNMVAKKAKQLGGNAMLCKTSVTEFSSVEAMVNRTIQNFGRIDILVNNVGGTGRGTFIRKKRSEWDKEVNLNLTSVLNCTKAVVDHMVAQRYGKIINMSSDAARIGAAGMSIYAASKAGVIALTKALARELGGYGINVNVICPGFVPPEQQEHAGEFSAWKGDVAEMLNADVLKRELSNIPMGRLGKPEDIANATIFLASEAASYITGQTLSVDGGWTMM